jgi:hypothetical protein
MDPDTTTRWTIGESIFSPGGKKKMGRGESLERPIKY